jgi:hypothetical protein
MPARRNAFYEGGKNGEWRMRNGELRMKSEEWRMRNGELRMKSEEWRMMNDE